MRNIVWMLALGVVVVLASFRTTGSREYKVTKVVIDAGHGGKDPGTHGASTKEKDLALKIALQLGRIIEENMEEVEVIYTRDNDTFISLYNRAEIANKNDADLFISIHCNAAPGQKSHGTETFVMGLHTNQINLEVAKRENSVILLEEDYEANYEGFDPNSPEAYILFSLYQNAYLMNSLQLAEKIEGQFKQRVGRRSRGVKQAGFVVLWKTSMPSVLVEVGFLSNPAEETYLKSSTNQVYIASGIYRAFRDYKKELEELN